MTTYFVNAGNRAIGASSGLSIIGVAVYGGNLYGIKTDGLVELTGADDEGVSISGVLKSGKLRFGSSDMKRSKRLYIEGSASNGLAIETTTEEWGESKTRKATVQPFKGSLRPKIVKLAGKPKTPYYQVQISNVNGGTMKIRNMELLVELLDRKA